MNTFQNAFQELLEKLNGWLDTFIVNLPNLLVALLVMGLAYWLSRLLKRSTVRLMKRFSTSSSVNNLVGSLVSMSLLLLALFVALGIMDLNQALTSLLAGAGVAGLAVGLALQEPLTNTFSGVMMSMRQYYNIGDWVGTNGFEGQIQRIQLRWTELQRPSGERIILPNKLIVSNPLENFSIGGRRRVDIECGITYESDLDEVQEIAKAAIASEFNYVESPEEVEFFYTEFGGSSINFVLRFWMCTKSLIEYKKAKSLAIVALKKAFDQSGIEIPFPIRTLDFSRAPELVASENSDQPAQEPESTSIH